MDSVSLVIIICVVIIVIAVIISNIVKKNKKAKQIAARVAAEQNEKENLRNRFEKNVLVQQWAKEIAGQAKELIEANRFTEIEFQVVAYAQDFQFGLHLQQLWWESTRDFTLDPNARQLFYAKFAEHNLPKLTSNGEEEFSYVICNIAKGILAESNIRVVVRQVPRFLTGLRKCRDGDENIYCFTYTPAEAQGSW